MIGGEGGEDQPMTAKNIIKQLLSALMVGACLASGGVFAQTLPLPPTLIAFDSPSGEELFLSSHSRADFWDLSIQFLTQLNQAYCGVASMVMVLNALKVPAPEAAQYAPYHVLTQENFFANEATRQVLNPEVVARDGMTLDQLGHLLASYSVGIKVYHSADTSLDEFRRLVAENLRQPDNFVLVNYLRAAIDQEKGGHISPIAAYHEQTDQLLILDVARYKYPPVWVKAEALWQAMATVDSVSGKTRGFVLVSRTP